MHIVAALLCILVTDFPNFLKYYSFFHISMDINSVGVETTGQRDSDSSLPSKRP
jgi:hypothetical protein